LAEIRCQRSVGEDTVAVEIRHLTPDDAGAYVELRRRSLADSPLAFVASFEDDRVGSVEQVREALARDDGSVTIGAWGLELVGVVGLYRDAHLKCAHKAHLWGMFVSPAERGAGIGRRLLGAVLDHARSLSEISRVHLSVSELAVAARHLYEAAGFETWGTEPDAIRYRGQAVSEIHMVLALDRDAGALDGR
jgi:RimJ/RimL family protein N-acetyltransferase